MFKMKKRSYRVFEGLRVATLVSYIGGFIDAYTYNTQDRTIRKYSDRESSLFSHSPC